MNYKLTSILLTVIMLPVIYLGYYYGMQNPDELTRCKSIYASLNEQNFEESFGGSLQEFLDKNNVKSLDELITLRCKMWIKNGQKF